MLGATPYPTRGQQVRAASRPRRRAGDGGPDRGRGGRDVGVGRQRHRQRCTPWRRRRLRNPGSPASAPGHLRRERREPSGGNVRVRGVGRVRRVDARERGLSCPATELQVRPVCRDRAPPTLRRLRRLPSRTCRASTSTRWTTPGRERPSPPSRPSISSCRPSGFHQRVRGRRLHRVPGRQHRAHPARYLHVPRQGRQRSAAGACGRRHLQRGQRRRSSGLLFGDLDPPLASIPVVGTTFALGAGSQGRRLGLQISVTRDRAIRQHLQRDRRHPDGQPDRTVVVGAHLDSVREGPGINDNGSGTATILEVALQMAELDIEPENRVRFAFWGARRTASSARSTTCRSSRQREIKQHAVNLNFDMVGSPNFGRFVYDGDGSASARRVRTGRACRARLRGLLRAAGLADVADRVRRAQRLLRLHQQRHPAGGLFTGAEDVKTAEDGRCSAEPPVSGSTPATTRRATTSTTSASRHSTRCRTRSPMPC